MAIVIQQDKDQARLAFELQSHADLDSIRLVELTAKTTMAPEDAPFPLRFLMKHTADEVKFEGTSLTVPIKFAFKAVTSDSEVEIVFVACQIEATYELSEGFTPTPEQINAFKDGNAVFNCWPYFRELVHNTITRMNYPPATLPFLRLVPRRTLQVEATKAIADSPAVQLPRIEPQIEGAAPPRRRRASKRK